MCERSNEYAKRYSEGRLAKAFAKEGAWKLPAGQVILENVPDIKLSEVMEWAGMVVDPNGSGDPETDAFKYLQRKAAQSYINDLYNYEAASGIAERLDNELNPDLKE